MLSTDMLIFAYIWGCALLVQYFRLSLKAVEWPDVFGALDQDGRRYSRDEWLRSFFSRERAFEHRGKSFMFIPARDVPGLVPSTLIVGYVARERVLSERTPPSAGFEPTEHGSWQGALVVVDPSAHDDGQKVAMEARSDIGKPLAILRSLANTMTLSVDHPRPFDVQIHPIVEQRSFWRFAEQHDFQINLMSFDVAPPNMFGGADDFRNELRQLRERNRVNRVKATLTSATTIDVRQKNIEEVVTYTELGAGSIRARTTKNQVYNSNNHIKSDQVDTEQGRDDFWSRLVAWMGEAF